MRPVDARVEPLLAQLSEDSKLPRGAEDHIRQSINESPYLSHLLANAATAGQIGRIAVSYGEHNSGHFQAEENGQPGTLYLSESNFKDFSGEARLNLLTAVMGHEAMHGVLARHRSQALDEFTHSYRSAMDEAYQAREPTVNLTEPVRRYLDKGRQDEALAEVSGLRAVNSRLKRLNPDATEQQIEAMLATRAFSKCVVNQGAEPALAPGISYAALNDPAHPAGAALTQAVERCFYDGAGSLGRHGDSDYRNYYGVDPLARIARDFDYLAQGRRPPDLRIDLKDLGLDPRQLERNGLDLGQLRTLTITDGSKGGMEWVQLKHTAEANSPAPDMAPNRIAKLRQADQGMLEQIQDKVRVLDQAHGRAFDETSERMSASLLAAAKNAGLTRVDHVVLSEKTPTLPAGQNLFAVQGDPANPASLRTHLPTAEAAAQPVHQSLAQVESINQRQMLEQQTFDQRTQEQQRGLHLSL